jgi:hypothetical protein
MEMTDATNNTENIEQLRLQLKKQKKEAFKQVLKHWSCFWTFPFGHVFQQCGKGSYDFKCACCGKEVVRGD